MPDQWDYKEIEVQTYESPESVVKREGEDGWEVEDYEMGTGWVGSSSGAYPITLVRRIRFKRRK